MAGLKARLHTVLAIILVLSALLGGCTLRSHGKGEDEDASPSPSGEETTGPNAPDDTDAPTDVPTPEPTATPEGGVEPIPPTAGTNGGETPPASSGGGEYERQEPEGVDVPEREALENSFFSDAAFVGNSLVEGLRMFSGITECDYYSATSMSVLGIDSTNVIKLENGSTGTIMQGLAQKTYAKVYILLGINEIGCDTDYFKDEYAKMLDEVRDIQPDADIYIMSLTPVSYNKSSTSDTFNMTRVKEFNGALHELAEEKECYYLDLCTALAGSDGYLPADVTSDGVHFSVSVYADWADYLRTHYV